MFEETFLSYLSLFSMKGVIFLGQHGNVTQQHEHGHGNVEKQLSSLLSISPHNSNCCIPCCIAWSVVKKANWNDGGADVKLYV